MSVSSVKILDGCTLCGICEQICPEVFKVGETTTLINEGVDLNQYESQIREAAEGCPVSVIEVTS